MTDLSQYRPNVGVVLFNGTGNVWLGRRANTPGPYNWQFPQGGIDDDEDIAAAALRELEEETGVHSVTRLGRTDGWLTYDFPADHRGAKQISGWKGQRQVWFALRFDGQDSEVSLTSHGKPEFDAWRWGYLEEAPDLVVPFKRAAYESVVEAFLPFAARQPTPSA